MYYDKRIRYLNYYESGIKLQNAGYVKFQVRDSVCQMILYIKGPRLMGSGEANLYLLSEKQEEKERETGWDDGKRNLEKHLLGKISIRNGQGHCAVRMNTEDMGNTGLWYDEVCGIKVELHEYQYLESTWTVVNLIAGKPPRVSMRTERETGYGQRQKDGWVKRSAAETDVPVEINLKVRPVSGNVRVERTEKKEEIVSEAEEIEEEKTIPRAETAIKEETVHEAETAMEEETVREAETVMEEETVREAETAMEEVAREVETAIEEVARKAETVTEKETAGEAEAVIKENAVAEAQENENRGFRLRQDNASKQEAEAAPKRKGISMQEAVALQDMPQPREAMPEEIHPAEEGLKTDKWEQLRETYPIVHPIREEEEYLKIAPKDFVIFTEKYQELVHNSFLLHGYYNYKHLILGKKEKGGKTIYYLGVPGTFHEREKKVAVMFGFEAFDGKREPAQMGDFGYYLRRVEL